MRPTGWNEAVQGPYSLDSRREGEGTGEGEGGKEKRREREGAAKGDAKGRGEWFRKKETEDMLVTMATYVSPR